MQVSITAIHGLLKIMFIKATDIHDNKEQLAQKNNQNHENYSKGKCENDVTRRREMQTRVRQKNQNQNRITINAQLVKGKKRCMKSNFARVQLFLSDNDCIFICSHFPVKPYNIDKPIQRLAHAIRD